MNLTNKEYEFLVERLTIECRRLSTVCDALRDAQRSAIEEVNRLRAENERLRRASKNAEVQP